MKIIYLHQYFTTPKFKGGTRSYEFSKRLVAAGHKVDIITSSAFFPIKKKKFWHLVSQLIIDDANVHVVHVDYKNKMTFFRRVLAFLLFSFVSSLYILSMRKRDLIYASSTPLTIGIPALIGSFFLRIPFVFEVRDLWPDIPIDMGFIKNKFLIKILYFAEKFFYMKAAKIVCLSPGIKDAIISKGISSKKTIVISNACDIEEFSQAQDNKPLQKYRVNKNTKICLYTGTFGVVNYLQYLINLMYELKLVDPNIQMILIGDGSEKRKLANLILKKKLTANIHLLDSVSKKEIIAYVHDADACISTVKNIPSLFNNSANKFFDALAAGKPIVINHPGWLADLIKKNNLGVELNYDYLKSARKLSSFLRHDQESSNTRNIRIQNFAKDNFSRDKIFQNLLDDLLAMKQP